MIVTEAGQIALTGACGAYNLRTDLQYHEGTFDKTALSNSQA